MREEKKNREKRVLRDTKKKVNKGGGKSRDLGGGLRVLARRRELLRG